MPSIAQKRKHDGGEERASIRGAVNGRQRVDDRQRNTGDGAGEVVQDDDDDGSGEDNDGMQRHAPASNNNLEHPVTALTGRDAAASLQTTSYDALRQALVVLRSATALRSQEERPAAADRRISLVKDFISAGGIGGNLQSTSQPSSSARGLMDAWDLADAQQQPAILPLPLFALANIINLVGVHQPDHELGDQIISMLLPASLQEHNEDAQESNVAPRHAKGKYWQRIQGYLINTDSTAGQSLRNSGGINKGKGGQKSSRDGEVLTLATLRLLLAISSFASAKYARVVFDAIPWSRKSLGRLMTKRRRLFVNKRDRKAAIGRPNPQVTLDRPDIRTLWVLVLLSFLRTTGGASTAPALRIAALSLGKEFYPAMLKGLLQDPAPIVAHVLLGLHDGILSDDAANKLPRSSTVSLFSEWSCKDLVSLYEREHDFLQLNGLQDTHSIADVAHHFLLALCTHPGRGVCYVDNGWYGKEAEEEEKEIYGDHRHDNIRGPAIYNKILYGVLRSLQPSKSPKQAELALRIMGASSELVGLYLSQNTQLEPRAASLSWLSTASILGSILELPLPTFRRGNGQWMAAPPSSRACIAALFPASLTRTVLVKAAGHSDRLVRYAGLVVLIRFMSRLQAFKQVCLEAAGEEFVQQGLSADLDFDAVDPSEDDVLSGNFGFERTSTNPWQVRRAEMLAIAKERLPSFANLLDVLDAAASTSIAEKPAKSLPLDELTLRAAWLRLELLGIESEELSSSTLENLIQTGIASKGDGQVSGDSKEDGGSYKELNRLHALRIMSRLLQLPSQVFNPLSRAPHSTKTFAYHLYQFLSESPELRTASKAIIASAMQSSVLFEHDSEEWLAWDLATELSTNTLLEFLDECLQRCLKTPYRYIELGRKANASDDADGAEIMSASLLSPLLYTMLEQWCIRLQKGLLEEEHCRSLPCDFLIFLSDLLPGMIALKSSAMPNVCMIVRNLYQAVTESTSDQLDDLHFSLDVLQSKIRIVHGNLPSYAALPTFQRSASAGHRPPSQVQLRKTFASRQLLRSLSGLHPTLENLKNELNNQQDVPTCILAYHSISAIADHNLKWSSVSAIEAKLLFCAAKAHVFEHANSEPLSQVVQKGFEYGLFEVEYLEEHLLANEQVLDLSRNDSDLFRTLLACAALVYGEKDQETPGHSQIISLLADIAGSRHDDSILSILQLASFLPSSVYSTLFDTGLEQSKSSYALSALCEVVRRSHPGQSQLPLIKKLIARSAENDLDSTEAILSLIADSQPTLQSKQSYLPEALEDIINFIITAAKCTGADAALNTILEYAPNSALYALSVMTSAEVVLPFSTSRALSLLASSEKEKLASYATRLIELCALKVFQSPRDEGIALAESLKHLAIDFVDKVKMAILDQVPQKPADAFKESVFLLTADIFDASTECDKLQPLLEKALLHLVRRFAEDPVDSADTYHGVAGFVHLLKADSSLCRRLPHLAEPVLTAAIKNRLHDSVYVSLIGQLLPSKSLGLNFKKTSMDVLLRANSSLSQSDIIEEIVTCVYACAMEDHAIVTEDNARALVRLYRGSTSQRDRKILVVLRLLEEEKGVSILDILARWTPPIGDAQIANVDDTAPERHLLLTFDSARIHETCLKYPRGRGFADLLRYGFDQQDGAEDEVAAAIYDPLLILASFGSLLADERPWTSSKCIELLRTNCLGLVICSLSSIHQDVRTAAAGLLAQAYALLERNDFSEKDQLLLIFDAIRNAYEREQSSVEVGVAPLPLTTTLFAAHALRALSNPSIYLYPSISRFLLQRATPLDQSDVPLLYSFLYSSSIQSLTHRQERLFIIRFATACVRFGGRSEWRILKKRHVWHAMCSLYAATADNTVQRAIEDFWEAAAVKSHIAMSVVLRQSFLVFLQQIASTRLPQTSSSREVEYWIKLVRLLVSSLDLVRVQAAYGPAWIASLVDVLTKVVFSWSSSSTFSPTAARSLNDALTTLNDFCKGAELPAKLLDGDIIDAMHNLASVAEESIKEHREAESSSPQA